MSFAEMTFQEYTLESKILNQTMYYGVIYPNGYSDKNTYPVIYALHGANRNHTLFTNYLQIYDQLVADGIISPFIMVTPDAKMSFYINSYDNTFPFEKYFYDEFMPHIESTLPVEKRKEFRMLLGTSMGGFGSGLYSLKHKELFGAASLLSPALMPEGLFAQMDAMCSKPNNQTQAICQQMQIFYNLFGNNEYYLQHNYNNIIKTNSKNTFTVPTYICIGMKDELYPLLQSTKQVLNESGIPFEWEEDAEGEHTIDYWKTKMPNALKFIQKYWDNAKNSSISVMICLILCILLFI